MNNSIVELRKTVIGSLNNCIDGNLSSESLKAINGSAGKILGTIMIELRAAQFLEKDMNKDTKKFLFIDGQLDEKGK